MKFCQSVIIGNQYNFTFILPHQKNSIRTKVMDDQKVEKPAALIMDDQKVEKPAALIIMSLVYEGACYKMVKCLPNMSAPPRRCWVGNAASSVCAVGQRTHPVEVQSEPHLPSNVVLGQLVTERIGLENGIVLSFSS